MKLERALAIFKAYYNEDHRLKMRKFDWSSSEFISMCDSVDSANLTCIPDHYFTKLENLLNEEDKKEFQTSVETSFKLDNDWYNINQSDCPRISWNKESFTKFFESGLIQVGDIIGRGSSNFYIIMSFEDGKLVVENEKTSMITWDYDIGIELKLLPTLHYINSFNQTYNQYKNYKENLNTVISDPDLFDKITLGFELETQKTEGEDCHSVDSFSPQRRSITDVLKFLRNDSSWKSVLRKQLETAQVDGKFELGTILLNTLNKQPINKFRDLYKFVPREDINEFIKICYQENNLISALLYRNLFNLPPEIKVKDDGSVRGFEFVTESPVGYEEFLRLADRVFALDHEIDTKCSFHIHIGIKDFQFIYDPKLYKSLVWHFMNNIQELPACVLERLTDEDRQNNGRGHEYAQLNFTENRKYNFIHFHNEYPTIEWRMFGNVSNYEDAKACLDFALKVLKQTFADLSEHELEVQTDEECTDMCLLSLKHRAPISKVSHVFQEDKKLRRQLNEMITQLTETTESTITNLYSSLA